MKFAVCVNFVIHQDAWEDFLPLMMANARTSLEKEEGCMQFDVCTDEESPLEVFLYEIYSSPEAFSEHLASDHFKEFDAAVADMIAKKSVKTYRMVG